MGDKAHLSSLQESEERLRVLLQVSDAAKAQADPNAIVAAALETLRQELKADRIAWAEVEDDEEHFTFSGCVAASGVATVHGRYPVSAFGVEGLAAMRAGRSLVVSDCLTTEDEVDQATYRAIGIRALIAAPIHRDGRFIAGIGVHSRQARHWTESEIELTQLVAERIWEALERARAEHALTASEARFRYLADAVPHLVWTVRRDGTATYYNQQVRAYGGIRSPGETPDGEWDWSPGLHPDDMESTLAKWHAAIEGREPYEVEHRILMNDGTYRWHLSRALPAGGLDAPIWFGTSTDIHDLKEAESARRESEERFRTMADGVPLVIWVHDAEGKQVFVNQTFCDYFGVTREKTIEDSWQVLTHPDDGTRYAESFLKAVAERRSFHAEVRVKRFDGQWRWIESWGRPRFASDGTFLGIVGTSADITDRKEVERRTKQLNEELEAKVATRTAELLATNAQLQGFTYSVAHDLRQQIRGINVNASILLIELGQNLDDGNRETLARLVSSSKQLGRLVDDLLAYARLGKQEPTRVALDLTSLSEEVVSVVIERGGTRQGTRFTIGRDLMGYGDPSMLRLVLENLIDNACKYSADLVQPHIEIGRFEEAFYVRDNGIGFDMQYAHKLFEPFERLHRESEFAGTGIGLANVKRIIEKHGGRVWAEGRPGAGATFFFTLPSTDET